MARRNISTVAVLRMGRHRQAFSTSLKKKFEGNNHLQVSKAKVSLGAVSGTLQNSEICSPWADGLFILIGHDPRDLMKMG